MKTEFDGQRAYHHLEVLGNDIGPRHGSSKSEATAARYIHGYFKGLGLKARYESYPIYSFEKADARLSVPGGTEIPCKPIPMTANTPARGITAEVVCLEDSQEAFLEDRITGRIVFTFDIFDKSDYERFLLYIPAGLVSIQSNDSQLHVAGSWACGTKQMPTNVRPVWLACD